jgi:hypothetical protein
MKLVGIAIEIMPSREIICNVKFTLKQEKNVVEIQEQP